MILFADLLERLTFTTDTPARVALLRHYCETETDPGRGYGLGLLMGAARAASLRPGFLRTLAANRLDPDLFRWSHAFSGDLTETIALMWPSARGNAPPPRLAEVLLTPRAELPDVLPGWLDASDAPVRLALLKLVASGTRTLATASTIRLAVAEFGGVSPAAIEEVWHSLSPPYADLFAWLEHRGPRPALSGFRPFMSAGTAGPGEWLAEPLWQGSRIQVAAGRVYARTADDITAAHPDWRIEGVVLDGIMTEAPRRLRVFDMLAEGMEDLRGLDFVTRRARLEQWLNRTRPPAMVLSPLVPFAAGDTGLMFKRADSPYVAGRAHSFWVKRPHPPRTIAAMLLYAEAGVYTVGLWRDGALVPVGQAAADDAAPLESWVRDHTVARFGPVREVAKSLVVSVTFGSVRKAPRRKAGAVLVHARIVGILDHEPADDLDVLTISE